MDNTIKYIQKVKYYKYKSLEREFVVKDDKGVRCAVIVMQCIGKKRVVEKCLFTIVTTERCYGSLGFSKYYTAL